MKKIILFIMISSSLFIVGCAPKVLHLVPAEELNNKKIMEIMKDKNLSDEEKVNFIQRKMTEDMERQKSAVQIEKDNRMRGLIQKPVVPLRTPDTILRVLILPYEDDNGVLNSWKYSYIKVEDGKWVIADYLNSSLASSTQTFTPLNAKNIGGYTNTAPSRRIVADTHYDKNSWYAEKAAYTEEEQKKMLAQEWANLDNARIQLEKERALYEQNKGNISNEEIKKEKESLEQKEKENLEAKLKAEQLKEEAKRAEALKKAEEERLRIEEEKRLKAEEEAKRLARKAMIDKQLKEIELNKANLEFMENELNRAKSLEDAKSTLSEKEYKQLEAKLGNERAKDLAKIEKLKNEDNKKESDIKKIESKKSPIKYKNKSYEESLKHKTTAKPTKKTEEPKIVLKSSAENTLEKSKGKMITQKEIENAVEKQAEIEKKLENIKQLEKNKTEEIVNMQGYSLDSNLQNSLLEQLVK